MTICARGRSPIFGQLHNGQVEVTGLGRLITERWADIPRRDPGIVLDESIVMPDHVHGVLIFHPETRIKLPRLMAWFKGTCVVEARKAGLWGGEALWQRGYYDHVIRGPEDLDRVRAYIRSNPMK
ncbi:MAG: transposase [Gemmatimonadales bacterium]